MQPLNDQFKEVCGFPDHSTLDTLNIHSHSLNCCGDTFWCLGWGECKEESSSMFIMAYQLITICSGLESVAYIEATWWIFEWMNPLMLSRKPWELSDVLYLACSPACRSLGAKKVTCSGTQQNACDAANRFLALVLSRRDQRVRDPRSFTCKPALLALYCSFFWTAGASI